mgnify:CR=1 FL=1
MNSDFCVAVHVLVYLNRRGCVLSSEELARNICTNPARVRKVLARMKKDGLVETKEGSSGGGYRFAKGAGEVSLAQVARALEVRFVSTSWHSGSQEVKCLVATGMAQVMDALFDDLDGRCMARLEEIVGLLERGDAPLDEAMALFEEGAKLMRECTKRLDQAEQKVTLLTAGEDGQPREEPFGGGL